jgi:hypothetical protein
MASIMPTPTKMRPQAPRTLPGLGALAALLCATLAAAPAALAEERGVSLEGPDVTIIAGEERTVFEFRQNGQLRMVRVVPKWGKPYYLVPRDQTSGFGDLERADMLLPSWVIAEF